jgi:hypothetical protein
MSSRYTVPAAWRTPAPAPPPSTRGPQTAIVRELARLGWTDARRAAHLTSRYGYTDVAQLDTLQAAAFLIYLRGCRPRSNLLNRSLCNFGAPLP